jgi:hypothetical protein
MSKLKDDKQRKQLSNDELRTYKGFENCSNEQAREIICSLEKLSQLFYELYLNQQLKMSIENEK